MSVSLPTAVRVLRRASLIYLGLPVVIFFAGWLRAPLAAGCTALLGWAIWRNGWNSRGEPDVLDPTASRRLPWWAVVFGGIVPATLLVAMSGAGGWGAGDSDWFKHDTVLYDLVTRDWPVTYGTTKGPILLVYYTAFYLPAALLGKWTGSYALASQALAATMLIGIWLSLAWLWVLGRSDWWRACGLFFGFAGMDVLGKAAVNIGLGLPAWYGDWSDIEWWAQAFQYPSNAAALFWAPQHAIGAWLPTALVLAGVFYPARGHSPAETGGLPVVFTLFWAPFAAVGLTPFVVCCGAGTNESPAGVKGWVSRFFTPANLAAVCLAAPVLAYYAARSANFAVPEIADVVPGRSPTPLLDGHPGRLVIVYAGFVVIEFGALALALAGPWRGERGESATRERRLLLIATLLLLLLPTLHYGYANDLVMRGALPALWVLQVLVLRRFPGNASGSPAAPRWPAIVCASVLAVGLCNAGLEYARHLNRMRRADSWRDQARATPPGEPPAASLFQLQRTLYNRPGFDFARQYLGGTDSFYGRWLAPQEPSAPQPVAE